MRDKLLRALGESGTVRRGDALLLAVSGGADSTALLLALHALRPKPARAPCPPRSAGRGGRAGRGLCAGARRPIRTAL